MNKFATFKNGALVSVDKVQHSGFYIVLARNPSGDIVDKVMCDTYREALYYFKSFKAIVKQL